VIYKKQEDKYPIYNSELREIKTVNIQEFILDIIYFAFIVFFCDPLLHTNTADPPPENDTRYNIVKRGISN